MTAHAYYNWGRWVADCPDPHCSNAEQVDPPGEVLVCSFCLRSWPLVWPDNGPAIEAVLALRPVPATRNWLPGESLATLKAENVAHLVAVL